MRRFGSIVAYLAIITAIWSASTSFAREYYGVCVGIGRGDSLNGENRRDSAVAIVSDIMRNEGIEISEDDHCKPTYILTHHSVTDGGPMTISFRKKGVNGKRGFSQSLTVVGGDTHKAYNQLVKAVIKKKKVKNVKNRNNVTRDEAKPNRITADNLAAFSLGFAPIQEMIVVHGTYRYSLDDWAVNFDYRASLPTQDSDKSQAATGFQIGAIYYFFGESNISPYVGLGLGVAFRTEELSKDVDLTGAGLDVHGRLGVEMLRTSTIRMFGQVDLNVPTYKGIVKASGLDDEAKITKAFKVELSVLLGIGWTPTSWW